MKARDRLLSVLRRLPSPWRERIHDGETPSVDVADRSLQVDGGDTDAFALEPTVVRSTTFQVTLRARNRADLMAMRQTLMLAMVQERDPSLRALRVDGGPVEYTHAVDLWSTTVSVVVRGT